MSDPARTDLPAADALAGQQRDARVEQLLLTGLDHYFAGRYEHAIHVWTRVLFLDRGHARACAYIDRARSALAERQRESEELLHRGTAAFDGGEVTDARRLLTAAVERGAPPEVALAYLGRLDRLEAATDLPDPPIDALDVASPDTAAPARAISRHRTIAVGIAALAAVTAIAWFAGALLDFGAVTGSKRGALAPFTATDPVPVPNASDVTLARARALYETGRLQDAIRLLATIGPADANRAEGDRLLADIQRTLLASADAAAPEASVPR
jgi:tetratricopeptide (TPR) repeat protein